MEPLDISSNEELKALGRKKIIEMAKEAAKDAGSTMVPSDDKGIRVLMDQRYIIVELAKGFRAYSDEKIRIITSLTVQVTFHEGSPTISYEGNDIMTDADKAVLDFVLKSMPPNYRYESITIKDDPADSKFLVEIDLETTMGRHSVDKKTGEWTYITHKHYAMTGKDDRYTELKE